MFSQKSVLARLLANENIAVQQGNYETAFFDVKSRTLGLPHWKDMDKDMYDMLVGHEVSHALFTPTNFFEYDGSKGIPHSWLNIVEDIRIERLILQKYPGLVGNFKRAYHHAMFEMDLFGIKDKDLMELGFMDRLNIKAKARDLVDVPFAKDELPYVNMAMSVETYDDVIRVCQEIQKWLKEKQEESEDGESDGGEGKTITVGILTDSPTEGAEMSDVQPDIIIDMRENKGDENEDGAASDDESGDSNGDVDADQSVSGQTDDSVNGPVSDGTPEPNSGDADQDAFTDGAFKEAQKHLVEKGNFTYVEGVTKAQSDAATIPYALIAESRRMTINSRRTWGSLFEFPEDEYADFMKETKRIVNLMVKEFEMRKAAYRTLRARSSAKGSLDVTKLHKYRYDDNLFKQVTHLADSKSHGMIMLIDYSGSMHYMLPNVIRQTLALIMFCKRVGVPFEVYAFTNWKDSLADAKALNAKTKSVPSVTSVDCRELAILELFNSNMSKSDYEEAFRMSFWQTTDHGARSAFEDLGSTPLNESLMAMGHKIDSFRARYKVQKMTFIALTDGDSNGLKARLGSDMARKSIHSRRYKINVRGNIVETNGAYDQEATARFVKEIERMGVTTINYYITSSDYDLKNELSRSVGSDYEYKTELRNNGCVVLDDNRGYMRRFVLRGNAGGMSGKIKDFDVEDGMTIARIAKEFGKSSDSKRKSRILTQKFAELIS